MEGSIFPRDDLFDLCISVNQFCRHQSAQSLGPQSLEHCPMLGVLWMVAIAITLSQQSPNRVPSTAAQRQTGCAHGLWGARAGRHLWQAQERAECP